MSEEVFPVNALVGIVHADIVVLEVGAKRDAPAAELAFVLSSPLPEKTKEKILSENALRLLTK